MVNKQQLHALQDILCPDDSTSANCSHCLSGNKPRESCGKTCQGDRDDEWMGVSLARQDRADGKILVSRVGTATAQSRQQIFLMRTVFTRKKRDLIKPTSLLQTGRAVKPQLVSTLQLRKRPFFFTSFLHK